MKQILLALFIALPMVSVADEQPMSPGEFRKYAEGYTLYFERDGKPFGSERFEPGGQTLWRYTDGSCVYGAWRPHGGQVCFLYQGEQPGGEVLCWRVLRTENSMIARLLSGENAGLELTVTGRDKAPLLCGEPGTAT